jgi:PEP-CTERM motif
MFRFTKFALALAAFAALGLASAAATNAAPLVFSDRAVYTTQAASPQTAIDFNSATANNGYQMSMTFAGVTFQYVGPTVGSAEPGVGVVNGVNFGTSNNALGVNTPNLGAGTQTLLISLPTGTTSVGFDFKGSNSTQVGISAASYTVVVNYTDGTNSGPIAIANPSFTTFGFFGFVTTDKVIQSISIATNNGGAPLLDNVTFGPAAAVEPVPEPATLVLFGTGLAGVASLARRRRLRARKIDEDASAG